MITTDANGMFHLPDPEDHAATVTCGTERLYVTLSKGGAVTAPISQWPKLRDATPDQQANWETSAAGHGIHWPDLGVDISIRALFGRPS